MMSHQLTSHLMSHQLVIIKGEIRSENVDLELTSDFNNPR